MKKLFCLILLLTACKPADDNFINGYIEGEYVYVAPAASGMLDEVNVVKGQQVNIGDKLFAVDKEIWQANLQKAENDIEAATEQQKAAVAVLINAEKEYNRAKSLVKNKTVSEANYDAKLASFESAKAKVAELKALTAKAEQNLLQVKRQYEQNIATSKVSGVVDDVYFRQSEFVTAGNPVVSVLPPENVKIRFFVNEKTLPQIKYNQQVFVSCDGCIEELKAKVSYISPSAEYTPPVIYSNESRDKLVFMVEATFSNTADVLPVGLPVSVRIK